jgi:methionine-rich copper-binding protein CopC
MLQLLAIPYPAQGHAILLSAVPSKGEVVNGAHIHVSLRFNSKVDVKRSRLILMAPGGDLLTLNIDEHSSAGSLNSEARGLSRGPYVLRWQVLAADGHITRGEVPFRVQ